MPSKKNGYTLLELIVVIAGLAILAGLAFPNFLKYWDDSKNDEVQNYLNTIASDCLLKCRKNPESCLDDESLQDGLNLPQGYDYTDEASRDCSWFSLSPKEEGETKLVTFSFQTYCVQYDGNNNCLVFKIKKSSSFAHPDSEATCMQWATKEDGTLLCSETGDIQAIKDRIEKEKQERERQAKIKESYEAWLKNPGSGNYTADGYNVWAFNGQVLKDEEEYKSTLEKECGKELREKVEEAENTKYDGAFSYSSSTGAGCTIDTYLCNGVDVSNKEGYDACKQKELDDACDAELYKRKTNNTNGLFDKLSDGRGCTAVYLCNGSSYTSKDAYDESDCMKSNEPVCRSEEVCQRYTSRGKCVRYEIQEVCD